jgi:hypothetical protein
MAFQFDVKGKSGIGSASGSVTLDLDHARLGTFPLNQGGTGWAQVDTLQRTGLLTGSHTYTVTYSGDNSFQPSNPTNLSVFVEKGWPESFIFPSPGDVTFGAPLRLLLVVGGGGLRIPTGTIQLYDNHRPLGSPIPLQSSGQQGQQLAQAIASPSLSVGTHELQATYSGDADYHALTTNDFFAGRSTINISAQTGNATSVHLQQSTAAVALGQSDTYTVSVKAVKSGAIAPTGTVSLVWENNAALAGPTQIVNGTASFTVPWYFAGDTSIAAVYSGDANYSTFSSAVIVTAVKPATPTVTLSAASSPVPPNTPTSLSVSLVGQPSNPNLSAPYGQVQFFDSVNGSAKHALGFPQYLTTGNGGNPIFTLPITLPNGNNVITVHYFGSSSDWTKADSNSVTVVVQ